MLRSQNRNTMEKIKTLLKSKTFWIALVIGVVLAVAYGSKIPAAVKKLTAFLPGSDAKTAL